MCVGEYAVGIIEGWLFGVFPITKRNGQVSCGVILCSIKQVILKEFNF